MFEPYQQSSLALACIPRYHLHFSFRWFDEGVKTLIGLIVLFDVVSTIVLLGDGACVRVISKSGTPVPSSVLMKEPLCCKSTVFHSC